MRDVVGASGGYCADLVGNVATSLDESAPRLDGLEVLPGLLRQLFGEVLDEPRPASGVQHPANVGLFQQQQLGVSGDAAREASRRARKTARDGDVEHGHQHGVGAADPRAEGGQGGAQHVHPGVALGHHRQ